MEMRDFRCRCGRLLGRVSGPAEIKCPKCKAVNRTPQSNLDLSALQCPKCGTLSNAPGGGECPRCAGAAWWTEIAPDGTRTAFVRNRDGTIEEWRAEIRALT